MKKLFRIGNFHGFQPMMQKVESFVKHSNFLWKLAFKYYIGFEMKDIVIKSYGQSTACSTFS